MARSRLLALVWKAFKQNWSLLYGFEVVGVFWGVGQGFRLGFELGMGLGKGH